MSHHHPRRRRLKLRSFYIWHRYVGLTAALLVLILAVTGLALNHTERWQLDSRHVTWDWVLDWYGVEAPAQSLSFLAGNQRISQMGRHLYLDRAELPGEYDSLRGAVALREWLVVAADQSLLLLSPDGELIERLTGHDGVPAGLQSVGISPVGQLVVRGGHGIYAPDEEFLDWGHWYGNLELVQWSAPSPLPPALRGDLARHYRTEVLPLERVLLDLHSGRIFGSWGVYLMDAAALFLLFLAGSGSWLWIQQRRKRLTHRRAQARAAAHRSAKPIETP